jgi:hypothetical protein
MPPQSPYTAQKTLMPRGGFDAAGTLCIVEQILKKFNKILEMFIKMT